MRPEEEPEYTRMDAQIYYMLTSLDKERPVGGRKLSEATGIGETAVKEIAAAMRDCGWMTVSSAGMRLSEKGAEILRNIPIELVSVNGSEHVVGGHQRGVLIHGMAHAVMSGARQRDMGTSAGAHGASVFTMRSGDLMMYRCNMDVRDPVFAGEIRNKGMDEGDIVIICGADDPNTAAVSAIFAALDLFSDRGKKRRKARPPPSAGSTAARAEGERPMMFIRDPKYRHENPQFYYMLACLDEEGPLDASALSETTGILEWSVRLVAGVLEERGLITTAPEGMRISHEGRRVLRSIPIEFADVKKSKYAPGRHWQGMLIRGKAGTITDGRVEKRMGINNGGADAMSIFLIKGGALFMANGRRDMDAEDPEFAEDLRGRGMGEGDVMVICGATNKYLAVMTAIYVGLLLV